MPAIDQTLGEASDIIGAQACWPCCFKGKVGGTTWSISPVRDEFVTAGKEATMCSLYYWAPYGVQVILARRSVQFNHYEAVVGNHSVTLARNLDLATAIRLGPFLHGSHDPDPYLEPGEWMRSPAKEVSLDPLQHS